MKEDICESIKDCLLDLSDDGYVIYFPTTGEGGDDFHFRQFDVDVRIYPPKASGRYRLEAAYEWRDGLSKNPSGMSIFTDIRESLCFLISYMVDDNNTSVKGISIRFEESKYSRQVDISNFEKGDDLMDGNTWISRLESRSLSGLTKSHILQIDITFEKKAPKISEDNIIFSPPTFPELNFKWFRRLFKK